MQAHTASRRKDLSCHSSAGETGEKGGEECDTTRKSAERASEQHGDQVAGGTVSGAAGGGGAVGSAA
jgi:hypothetical protein